MSAPALLLAVPILAGVIAGALSSVDAQSGLVPLGAAWLAAALALYRGRSGLVVAATVVTSSSSDDSVQADDAPLRLDVAIARSSYRGRRGMRLVASR